MELNIKLIGNIGRLNKREPFIIADNEKLVLNFSCATPLTDYYIELKNGDKCITPLVVVVYSMRKTITSMEDGLLPDTSTWENGM